MDERSAVCENPATEFATALLTQEQIFSGAAQRLADELRAVSMALHLGRL
jgi:hypothetical protein